MKIVKKGKDPNKMEVRFTCTQCGTVFQCTQKEAPKQYQRGYDSDQNPYWTHDCPECKGYCTAKEHDLVDAEETDATQIVTVLIRDTQTGQSRMIFGQSVSYWLEGNGSCDCDRWVSNPENPMCDGHHRYLIVSVAPMPKGLTLKDFNQFYDEEFVENHLKGETCVSK